MEHVTRQAGAAGRCDHTRGMGVPADRNRGAAAVSRERRRRRDFAGPDKSRIPNVFQAVDRNSSRKSISIFLISLSTNYYFTKRRRCRLIVALRQVRSLHGGPRTMGITRGGDGTGGTGSPRATPASDGPDRGYRR
jgi:hypothetical protein